MREVSPEPELADLLAKLKAVGGVIDYVFLESLEEASSEQLHRAAAVAGMAAIDRRLEQWAISHASTEYPIEWFYRVHWDETKLIGESVSFLTFRGSEAKSMPIGNRAWSIPNVDGYRTAFFYPPHTLSASPEENAELFTRINHFVLGDDPDSIEIVSWSTDWSNYFDAGHEWWGAFFWTIYLVGSRRWVVIGASTTD